LVFCHNFHFYSVRELVRLIPGIGTIGWGHYDGSGNFHVDRPLLRGGNADLNMTTAMSAIFFVMWFVWAIQANGVGGFLKHLFGPKGETTGVVKILMVVIFFAVGWLEVISIMFDRSRSVFDCSEMFMPAKAFLKRCPP
jgi:F-type H+-transporting ATPase subunit a